MATAPQAAPKPTTAPKASNQNGNPQTGAGGNGEPDNGSYNPTGGPGGGVGGPPRPPSGPIQQTNSPFASHYSGPTGLMGGPTQQAFQTAGQSFSPASRLQGALPFWQSPGIQVGAQQGYDPGQQYAGQAVTGSLIQNNPMVSAALANYNQNVLPGIQDSMNAMGLGRSTAALNAMAKGQASILEPLYGQAADLENQQIQRETQQGQFSAGLSQADLNRLQGATESELGRRQQSAEQQQQGQQQLFQNLMGMGQANQANQQAAGSTLFGMGQAAQQTGQMANQNSYQDLLRQMGLSEEAINPFGGISGLLGTVTRGK